MPAARSALSGASPQLNTGGSNVLTLGDIPSAIRDTAAPIFDATQATTSPILGGIEAATAPIGNAIQAADAPIAKAVLNATAPVTQLSPLAQAISNSVKQSL